MQTSGRQVRGTPYSAHNSSCPTQGTDIEQLGAAGVGVVGFEVMFPAQAVDKVAVDGSQRQLPLLRQGSGFGAVLQNPCHFRRREIRRKRQTCFLLHHVGVVGQRVADFLGRGRTARQ